MPFVLGRQHVLTKFVLQAVKYHDSVLAFLKTVK